MHGVFILHTIISSVARKGNTGRTFSQRTLYTIQRISIPPTLSFRAQREIFFVPFFHDSFAKPFTGSTAYRLSAIRCFPFFAIGHSPSYRQRKRSLGSARDDDTGRTRFQHILCMMHGVFILHTIISSVARKGNTGRTFSQRTLYTIQRISIPPTLSFRAQREIFFVPFFHDSFAKPFTESTAYRLSCEKNPSASLGMTLREYRSLTLPIYFPCNNDTREAPSTFAALLFFMRRTTPLNPTT